MAVVVAATLGAATLPADSDAAVYGGTLGALTSALGPDTFYMTADAGRLTGIGLTHIVACPPSGIPFTLGTARVTPSSGSVAPDDVLVTVRNAGGRFSAQLNEPRAEGGRVELDVAGRVTSRHASGTLRFQVFGSSGAQDCAGETLHWRADRRPGRIFGGGIPQAGTVVLTRPGESDMTFHVSVVTTDCGGGPPWLVSNIVIKGFDIHRGRFERPVEDDARGVRTHVVYDIDGRVGDRRASGTLGGVLNGVGENQVKWTCAITTKRWSAASG
jgi:hypothetical protein